MPHPGHPQALPAPPWLASFESLNPPARAHSAFDVALSARQVRSLDYPTMWQSFLLQMAGVAATASLVVSNKFVLEEISMPCAAAVLVLAHNVGTMLVMRARGCLQDGQAKKVDCRWLLAVNILGSFAVLMSNVVLQHSTVTFHQLARLTAIPASAVVDYALDAKRCSPLQRVGLVTMCLGVVRAASGEVSGVTGATCAAAAAMVAGTLAVAVLTRIVCKREQVTTAEFMYHARDWQSNPSPGHDPNPNPNPDPDPDPDH